jgi:hypothetical protein
MFLLGGKLAKIWGWNFTSWPKWSFVKSIPDVEADVPGELHDLEKHDDGDASEQAQSSSERRHEAVDLCGKRKFVFFFKALMDCNLNFRGQFSQYVFIHKG